MTARNYKDYGVKRSSVIIISECAEKGFSSNWCGSIEDKEEVEKLCEKFNVYYADDWYGEWKVKE